MKKYRCAEGRIIACVDACKGIPTKNLKPGAVGTMIDAIRIGLKQLKEHAFTGEEFPNEESGGVERELSAEALADDEEAIEALEDALAELTAKARGKK